MARMYETVDRTPHHVSEMEARLLWHAFHISYNAAQQAYLPSSLRAIIFVVGVFGYAGVHNPSAFV
jgi:hypothetical protein